MKNFKFHGKFSNTDIQRFPNGWILRNDLAKCVKQSVVPGHQSNLIGKLIFVDPGIWGDVNKIKTQAKDLIVLGLSKK